MSYRLAFDHDPENPNPHPWILDSVRFATEAEAEAAGAELDAEDEAIYGEAMSAEAFAEVRTPWMILHDPREATAHD